MEKLKLLILRGAPASGKSSIAKKLRDFTRKIVWLKVDNFKPFFAEDSSFALDYVNEAALKTLKYFLDNGFSVVMEGVFQNPSCIKKALTIAEKLQIQGAAFQLNCSLETLIERDQNRQEVKMGCRRPMKPEVLQKITRVLQNKTLPELKVFNSEKMSLEKNVSFFRQFLDS